MPSLKEQLARVDQGLLEVEDRRKYLMARQAFLHEEIAAYERMRASAAAQADSERAARVRARARERELGAGRQSLLISEASQRRREYLLAEGRPSYTNAPKDITPDRTKVCSHCQGEVIWDSMGGQCIHCNYHYHRWKLGPVGEGGMCDAECGCGVTERINAFPSPIYLKPSQGLTRRPKLSSLR